MPGQITAPKSLCLLRLSAIGDVCHAVAAVQSIQRQCPDTKITWVIGKIEAQLLNGLPGVEFVVFDKRAGLQGYRDLRDLMKGRTFDVLLHMQVALRASLATWCIRAKKKIGFDSQRAKEGQWLFTQAKIAPQAQPHVLDGFMGFVKALGLEVTAPTWQMPLSQADEAWAKDNLPQDKPIAVIAPAASKAERNWHNEGYAAIADNLTQRGFQVVLCGGPTTMESLLAIDITSKASSELINLVAQTSLKQLLAVLKQAHLVIAPDTGPAHMAATVGTPVVGLYAHSNPLRTGPYLSQDYVVSCYEDNVQEQTGKLIADVPWGTRAKGSDLMNGITQGQVISSIDLLLSEHYPELTTQ